MFKKLVGCCLIFLSAQVSFVFAQQDSSAHYKDSVKNNILVTQSSKDNELAAMRFADSLEKIKLQNQLNALKSSNTQQKLKLLKELHAVKAKDSIRVVQQKHRIDSLKHLVKGFPVAPFNDTLFYIYTKLGSFSPQERAVAVNKRIRKLASDYFFNKDSLSIVTAEQTTDLVYANQVLIGIDENDALWMNTSKSKLATQYRNRIADAVSQYKQQTTWQTLLEETAMALLVIAVLIVIIYFINTVFRKAAYKVIEQKGKRLNGFKIKNYELLNTKNEIRALLFLLKILKWVLIITAAYMALPILFGIFPWTKGFAGKLISYFFDPIKNIAYAV